MADRSMIFRAPLKNCHLLGDAQKRSPYSSVNQDMQTASTICRYSLSMSSSWSLRICRDSSVFRVKAIVEATINAIDIIAKTWNNGNMDMYNDIRIEKEDSFYSPGYDIVDNPRNQWNCLTLHQHHIAYATTPQSTAHLIDPLHAW